MPPKGKGKAPVSAAVPQYALPASPPTPAPVPLKPKSQGAKLIASNYGVTILTPGEGTVDFVPRSGAVTSPREYDALSDPQKALAQTTTAASKRSDSSQGAKEAGWSDTPSSPVIALATADFQDGGTQAAPIPGQQQKKVKHYATAGGCTPYAIIATQDGTLLEVGTLEDGGDLLPLGAIPTKEQALAVRQKNAALRAEEEAKEATAALAATAAPTMRRGGQLASLPAKNPHRLSQHSSTAKLNTGAGTGSGSPLEKPEHGTVLSVACGSLHAVWVAIPPCGGSSKVWGVGCVEDLALSESAARAAGVVDYIPEGQPVELQCLSDEAIMQVWASGSVTFARGRRGLFALGKLGDHIQWAEPCLIVPALVNQVSPLSPVEEAVSVGIGADQCYILMSNGDILVLEEVANTHTSPSRESSKVRMTSTGGASKNVSATEPLWRIRNVTFELFPRVRQARRGSSSPSPSRNPAAATHGAGGRKFKEIYAGKSHFVTVDMNDGQIYGWGVNSFGQLGSTSTLGLNVAKAVSLSVDQLFGEGSTSDPASGTSVLQPPRTKKLAVAPVHPTISIPALKRATPPPSAGKGTSRRSISMNSVAVPKDLNKDLNDTHSTVNSPLDANDQVPTEHVPVSTVAATCSSWATIVYLSDGSLRVVGKY